MVSDAPFLSTMAVFPSIQCRCGKQVCSSPFREKMRDKQADRTSENAIRKGADRGLPNGSSIVSRMYCRIIKGLRFALFAGPPAFCRKTGILPVVQQMAFFEHSDYQALLETWLAGLQVLHERLYARQLFRNSGRSTEPRWYS